MKFKNSTERMIYAVAYVAAFNRQHDRGPRGIELYKFETDCAENATDEGESVVVLHRRGLKEHKSK